MPNGATDIIAFDQVDVWAYDERIGRTDLLRDISWRVRPGECWALLGRNGAGKSTLLSLAGAGRHPSQGTVSVLGGRLGRVDVRELRAIVGKVDAAQRIPEHLSLRDYVLTGATGTVQPLPGKLRVIRGGRPPHPRSRRRREPPPPAVRPAGTTGNAPTR